MSRPNRAPRRWRSIPRPKRSFFRLPKLWRPPPLTRPNGRSGPSSPDHSWCWSLANDTARSAGGVSRSRTSEQGYRLLMSASGVARCHDSGVAHRRRWPCGIFGKGGVSLASSPKSCLSHFHPLSSGPSLDVLFGEKPHGIPTVYANDRGCNRIDAEGEIQ